MRILAVTNLYPNPCQPQRAPYNRLIFRVLAEQHHLRIVAPIAWTDLARRHEPAALGRQTTWDGIPVEYPQYLFPPKVLRGWYGHCFRESIRATFHRAVAEFAPDLVYASWAYPDGWAAVQLAREAGLPVVVAVLGSDVLMVPPNSLKHRRTIEGLRDADAVVTVSRDLADKIVPFGIEPGRVRVICTGVDPNLFCHGPQGEARRRLGLGPEPVILAIGNLVPVKGIDVLIEACSRLAAAGAAFQCYVIGQGPMRPQLERQIAAAGLERRVHLLGSMPQENLPDWYRAATVVALPSRSEGVPNVQLEAAACGTPLVASRVGGIPEFAHLGQTTLVPPDDAGKLAQALQAAINDRSPRTAPGPDSSRNIADVVAEMADLFDDVLASHALTSLSNSPWNRRAAGLLPRPGRTAKELSPMMEPRESSFHAGIEPDGALHGRDIVCFSNDWSGDPLSKTHLMRILARDNRILWVNSIGYRAPTATKADLSRAINKLAAAAQPLREVEPNLFVLNPLAVPLHGKPLVNALNRQWLQMQVKRAMHKLGFRRPINWIFNPAAAVVAGAFDEDILIYYCVDEFSAFSGVAAKTLLEMETQLISRSDLVVVTSELLFQSKVRFNPNTVLVRHGVDFEHFRRALDPRLNVPAEIAGLPKPIIGYFGLIADWVDVDLMAHVARHFPRASLVVLGKATTDVSALESLPNVHLLGRKPYADLPAYCKGFDVALMPFRINELTLNSNPLKVREYLAAGLPVVSTPIPEVEVLSQCRIAGNPDQFVREVAAALRDPGPSFERGEAIRHESWEARVNEIRQHVAALRQPELATV